MHNEDKNALRRKLRIIRSSIDQSGRLQAAEKALETAKKLPVFNSSKRIGLYLNMPSEFPTNSLINLCHSRNKEVYCPVILSQRRGHMRFAPIRKQALSKNNMGISEPEFQRKNLRPARHLDLIFVPLLGFDQQGNRLGMGGGYYDRALAFKSNRHATHRPYLIGLAFSQQQLPELHTQAWDIPLDAIITEQGITAFNNKIHYY